MLILFLLILISVILLLLLWKLGVLKIPQKKSPASSVDEEASAEGKKKGKQATRGISWDDLGLGAGILWILMLIGAPFYAGLWISNEYFPKEVRTVTYVPYWNAQGKISATCWDIDPGLYVMSCSGNISQKPFVGERYTASCINGNPTGDLQLRPEELSQMIIGNLPEYGRLLITGSDINNPSGYVPVNEVFRVTKKNQRFCVTLNISQRKDAFETVKGSIQVEILKKRFPWLP